MTDLQKNSISSRFLFSSGDEWVATNLTLPVENDHTGKPFVTWGVRNEYPSYLSDLYHNCTLLKSVIDGMCGYLHGSEIVVGESTVNMKNRKGESIQEIVDKCFNDYLIYGGFSVHVIRNLKGEVKELEYIDYSHLRSDKDNNMFFYSKEWNKSLGRVKYITFPKFDINRNDPNSIMYFKDYNKKTYTVPIYEGAIIPIEIEISVNEYHINNIHNSFSDNVIITFNNGIPEKKEREEIEDKIKEKFSGSENAGRPIVIFSDDKEHDTSIQRLSGDNSDKKYEELIARCEQQIFTAFRAQPILFGVQASGVVFQRENYKDSYSLFNDTVISPIRKKILSAFNDIVGINDWITVTPMKINWEE